MQFIAIDVDQILWFGYLIFEIRELQYIIYYFAGNVDKLPHLSKNGQAQTHQFMDK